MTFIEQVLALEGDDLVAPGFEGEVEPLLAAAELGLVAHFEELLEDGFRAYLRDAEQFVQVSLEGVHSLLQVLVVKGSQSGFLGNGRHLNLTKGTGKPGKS